jgi:hypothetical protein
MPQTITIDGFGGGVNQRVPAVDIADNELVDALNMRLDGNRTLVTRPGLSSISGSEDFATGVGSATDVIALFYFETTGGISKVIACTIDGIHEADANSDTWAEITPAGGLTAATRWEFAVLNDLLILSNMVDPLHTWNGTDGTAIEMEYLNATDPGDPLSIEVMDNRLLFVDKASPNTLKWSALGNPLDHDTTGKTGKGSWNVGGAEGDSIERIFSHRGRLFIFKSKSVYHLTPGAPAEDTSQWKIPQLLKDVGLAAPDSVQIAMDDLIFLSHTGLLSLGATAQYGDWKQSELSKNIPALREWNKSRPYLVRSIIHPTEREYIISIPTGSSTVPDETWVMDFNQGAAWTRYDGDMAARAFAKVFETGVPRLYVGNDIVTREDHSVWQDNEVNYEKLVQTKSYSLGETMRRKLFHRFGVQFEAMTDPLMVEILYKLDQDSLKTKTINYSFAGLLTGSEWDIDFWSDPDDTGSTVAAYWSTELTDLTDLIYRIQGGPGRRAQVIDFRFRNDANEAFALKRISLDVTLLETHKMVSE